MGSLAKALRTTIPERDLAALNAYMEDLPESVSEDGDSQAEKASDKD